MSRNTKNDWSNSPLKFSTKFIDTYLGVGSIAIQQERIGRYARGDGEGRVSNVSGKKKLLRGVGGWIIVEDNITEEDTAEGNVIDELNKETDTRAEVRQVK